VWFVFRNNIGEDIFEEEDELLLIVTRCDDEHFSIMILMKAMIAVGVALIIVSILRSVVIASLSRGLRWGSRIGCEIGKAITRFQP
jgi:hypothetical protein